MGNDIARQFAAKPKRRGSDRTKFYVEGNPLARRVIFGKARKSVLDATHGNYPAPLKAIDVMEYGMSAGVERGLAREVEEVVPLIKEKMFRWMMSRGKEIGSTAVVADAWHQRSDVVTSVAALMRSIAWARS